MKYFYSFILAFVAHIAILAQQQTVTYTVTPATFNEDESITLTFDGSSINESSWGVTGNALYLWAWSYNLADTNILDCPTNGTWASSNEANKLTYNAGTDKYSITFIPKNFYNRTGIGKIGFLVKAKDGTGDKKTQDIYLEVGKFQITSQNPKTGTITFLNSGQTSTITATTSLAANYVIKANNTVVYSANNVTSISFPYTVTGDATMTLTATNPVDGATLSSTFNYALTPSVQSAAIPSWLNGKQGINYDPADPTKVGLVLYAPNKSFVHVIGSFNNYAVSNAYLMKRDTNNTNIFWFELTGLTAQQIYTFQYRTNDGIKIADPYSPLVLSPYDDPWIEAADYPNLPAYPAGQNFEVSVIQTAKPAYNWTVTNFAKPAKDNLIVYELLVRDFTAEQNWQSLINKIPYLKTLNINAIELMPVMEFDGNNSWGYNTAFHYALDKAYGTPEKFKEFIDKCHQNGIAVILDIALNHATGRNPLQRLWNIDPDGDGFGEVASNNPYFNQVATHSYSVFHDFNHSKSETRYYVDRVLKHWINEYKIDGFRWDLTKGFTQNCTGSDACTNSYQQDRVDVLKYYADLQWAADPSSIVIFEHLGTDGEESQWANHRLNEGKGIILWDKLTTQFNQNTMGFADGSNFNRIDFENHAGFGERRNISYPESHDEERINFKNVTYGNSLGSYDVKSIENALQRQKALGSVFLTVPGPKMIWQFEELGYDLGIFRCEDGTYNYEGSGDGIVGDCKLDKKPSAFAMFYDFDFLRNDLYNTWSKILNIRLANDVFNTKEITVSSGNLLPNIKISKSTLPSTSLKDVIVVANFTLTPQTVTPGFPYSGTWVNLMDNSTLSVSPSTTVSLQPGDFRIFGNAQPLVLGTNNAADSKKLGLQVVDNPVTGGIANIKVSNAKSGQLYIYDMAGNMVKKLMLSKENGIENVSVNGLQSGVYLIQLKSVNGSLVSKMIIK